MGTAHIFLRSARQQARDGGCACVQSSARTGSGAVDLTFLDDGKVPPGGLSDEQFDALVDAAVGTDIKVRTARICCNPVMLTLLRYTSSLRASDSEHCTRLLSCRLCRAHSAVSVHLFGMRGGSWQSLRVCGTCLQASYMVDVQVDVIMKMLGLWHVRDTIVGNELLRGVSGGERHRVTTAEMLVGPRRIMLMDEISTGAVLSGAKALLTAVLFGWRLRAAPRSRGKRCTDIVITRLSDHVHADHAPARARRHELAFRLQDWTRRRCSASSRCSATSRTASA